MEKQKLPEKSKVHGKQSCPFSLYDVTDFSSYLQGKMPEAAAERLFKHVEKCEECLTLFQECEASFSEGESNLRHAVLVEKAIQLVEKLKG